MFFLITTLTAISLSLDAFSLSIIYGTIINKKNTLITLSIAVGLFHFIMPLFGNIISSIFISKILTNTNLISFIIFLILGVEMVLSKNSNNNLIKLNSISGILLFAFTVSIDSFNIGITIPITSILFSCIMFSTISMIFTFVGLSLGKKFKKNFGNITTKIGGVILIILSFYYLFT